MKRQHTRAISWLYWCLGCVGGAIGIGAVAVLSLMYIPFVPKERLTVVIASNPIHILTVNTVDRTASVLRVPEDIAISGAYSLGKYPIASFWKMGGLDAQDRPLFARSVEQAFGIPVAGYIGKSYEKLFEGNDSIPLIRDIFSLRGISSFLFGTRVTNLSVFDVFSFYRTLSSVHDSDIKTLDIGASMSTYDEELPDGSTRSALDPLRIDVLIKNIFVQSSVRKEALSVRVINTTDVPELASAVSRQLSNSGVYVVQVESEDQSLQACEISGNSEASTSQTAKFISKILHCKIITDQVRQREDLVIRIGSDIGGLYTPRLRSKN